MSAGCDGKHAFESRTMAESAAGRARRNGSQHCSVYRCSTCWQWHIGSSVARQKARGVAR